MDKNEFLINRSQDDLVQFRKFYRSLVAKAQSILDTASKNEMDGEKFTPVSELKSDIVDCRRLYYTMLEFYHAYCNDKFLFDNQNVKSLQDGIDDAVKDIYNHFVFLRSTLIKDSQSFDPDGGYLLYQNMSPREVIPDPFLVLSMTYGVSTYTFPPIPLGEDAKLRCKTGEKLKVDVDCPMLLDWLETLGIPPGVYTRLNSYLCSEVEDKSKSALDYIKITDIDEWMTIQKDRVCAVQFRTETTAATDWAVGDHVRIVTFQNDTFESRIKSINKETMVVTLEDETPFGVQRNTASVNLLVTSNQGQGYTLNIPVKSPLMRIRDGERDIYDEICDVDGTWGVKRRIGEDLRPQEEVFEELPYEQQVIFRVLARDLRTMMVRSINSVPAEIELFQENPNTNVQFWIRGNSVTAAGETIGTGDPRDGEVCAMLRLEGASRHFHVIAKHSESCFIETFDESLTNTWIAYDAKDKTFGEINAYDLTWQQIHALKVKYKKR